MSNNKSAIKKGTITTSTNLKLMSKSQITSRLRQELSHTSSTPLTSMKKGSSITSSIKSISPHPHDVLCGRGGGINSHPGNKTFRQWVRLRKERYNLASSKAEKATISREIVHQVRSLSPPGRFLIRDTSSKLKLWMEIDDLKAMAKTSQALREGAPSIRAVHQHLYPKNKRRLSKKKNLNGAIEPQGTVTSKSEEKQLIPSSNSYGIENASKDKHYKVKGDVDKKKDPPAFVNSPTRLSDGPEQEIRKPDPPRMPKPSVPLSKSQNSVSLENKHVKSVSTSKLKRTHSLFLSEYSQDFSGQEEFNDPFVDEVSTGLNSVLSLGKQTDTDDNSNKTLIASLNSQNNSPRYVFSNLFDIQDEIFGTRRKASDNSMHSSLTDLINDDSFDASFQKEFNVLDDIPSQIEASSSNGQNLNVDVFCPYRLNKNMFETIPVHTSQQPLDKQRKQ